MYNLSIQKCRDGMSGFRGALNFSPWYPETQVSRTAIVISSAGHHLQRTLHIQTDLLLRQIIYQPSENFHTWSASTCLFSASCKIFLKFLQEIAFSLKFHSFINIYRSLMLIKIYLKIYKISKNCNDLLNLVFFTKIYSVCID